MDEATGKPIRQVPMTVTVDKHQYKMLSGPDGSFDVKPRHGLALWIAGDYAIAPPAVEIASEGYHPFKARGVFSKTCEPGEYAVKGEYLPLGDVQVRKETPPAP